MTGLASVTSSEISRRIGATLVLITALSGCRVIVDNAGDTTGTVTSVSAAGVPLNCGAGGSVCEKGYGSLGPETLVATPEPGYVFSGWLGACEGQGANCSLTLTANTLHETRALFDFSAVTVDSIADQQLSQNFAPFTLPASGTSSAGTITWSVNNSRPDAVSVSIDSGSGLISVSPLSDAFGNAEIEVVATVPGGDASSTRFNLVVTMPNTPVFACGTSIETETGDTLPGSYTLSLIHI